MATEKKKAPSTKGKIKDLPKTKKVLTKDQAKSVKGGSTSATGANRKPY